MGTPTVESLRQVEPQPSGASLDTSLLERLKQERPAPGCQHRYFMDAATGYLVPFRCRTWNCPEDGPRHGREVTEALTAACLEVGLRYHWTLTLPGEGSPLRGDPNASRAAVASQWNALRAFLRRRGVTFEYAVVPEWQADGTAHLEVALDRWVDFDLMSEAWGRQGGGFVWVTEFKGAEGAEEVARYLAKYLAKAVDTPPPWSEVVCTDSGRFRTRPWRRYWASRRVGRAMRDATERRLEETPPQNGREWVLVDNFLQAVPPAKGCRLPDCEGHCLQTFEQGDCHHLPVEKVEPGAWTYSVKCDCTPWRRAGIEPWHPIGGHMERNDFPEIDLSRPASFQASPQPACSASFEASPQPASGWSRGPKTPAVRAERGSELRGAPSSIRRCHACGRPPVVTFRGRAYCWNCWLDLPEKGADPGENVDAEAPPRAGKTTPGKTEYKNPFKS